MSDTYSRYFSLNPAPAEPVPELGAVCLRLPMEQGEIRILSPVSEGPAANWIQQRGEGFAGWGIAVDDVESAIARIRSSGAEPVPLAGGAWAIRPEEAWGSWIFVEPV